MKNYKDTLLMMQTEFPMRGDLGKKEPEIQKFWEELNVYEQRLAKNANNEAFYLHDGPPYANGSIHVGHALNKVLKDFIIWMQFCKFLISFLCSKACFWKGYGYFIGTNVKLEGRIQAREYEKKYEDGTVEKRVAYEVSVSKFEEYNKED